MESASVWETIIGLASVTVHIGFPFSLKYSLSTAVRSALTALNRILTSFEQGYVFAKGQLAGIAVRFSVVNQQPYPIKQKNK
jgi:hypothetical protein